MRAPPFPLNEDDRLADLHDYGILDTPAEKVFDEIAELAATICGTPFAAVTLVDKDRQWFKTTVGLNLRQLPREQSVCGHAILEKDFFEVRDTRSDERFASNPLLNGDQMIRFYGGSRLDSDRGNPVGMLCVMDSVPRELSNTQKQALRQLADVLMAILEAGRRTRLLNWFGVLVDNIGDEILILDPDSLLYLHANSATLATQGLSLEQMRCMTPYDFAGSEERDLNKFEQLVQRLRAGEEFIDFDGHRRRADGEIYPVEARWRLLQMRGKPVILSIVRDVTERRKIERMKDEFMSVVSHELRTPLTSIHGAVKLIESGAAGPLPEHAALLIKLAAQNSQRLCEIVDDILDLEKIASGRMDFDIEFLGAREALEQVAASYGVPAQQANVVFDIAGDPALKVRADAKRLQQVLANVVSNAVKFAPPLSVVYLHVNPAPEATFVRLTVTDNGIGVPDDFRDRIFERFAQANMQSSRSKGGSGLGLAIARQLVEKMGGRIDFESSPGLTMFHVDLPKVQA